MLRNNFEVFRDEMVMKDRIIEIMKDGPKTVIEVSKVLNMPSREVMCWMMAMRRYGKIGETGRPDEDGYFKYKVKEKDAG